VRNTDSRFNINLSALVIGSLLAVLLIACNPPAPGSDEENGGESNQQSSQQSNQQSNQSTASNSLASTEACQAFGGVGGLGLGGAFANYVSSSQGGPTVQTNYSANASSDEARAIANFFEDALEDALDDDVSAECFWEVNSTQGGVTNRAMYVSLSLPEFPDAEAVGNIQSALTDKGASVLSSSSSTVQGQSYAMVMVNALPLDLEGEVTGMLILSEEYAILYAGQDLSSQENNTPPTSVPPSSSAGSSSSSAGSSGSVSTPPTQAPAVSNVSVNGGQILATLKDEFEDALDVTLVTENNFQSTSPQGVSVVISFIIEEGSTVPSDAADRLEDVAKSHNANVTGKFTSQGTALVVFENLEIQGNSATGSFAISEDQENLIVTLTIQ
jgi:hypothetical protein